MQNSFYFWGKILFLLFVIIGNTYAQSPYRRDFIVGKEPMGVFYDNSKNIVHVFCGGYDANFDGKKDPR